MARQISESDFRQRVISWLPKGIPAEAIRDVECDSTDGENGGHSYWVCLARGYWCPAMECHTIHEDRLTDVKRLMRTVEVWAEEVAEMEAEAAQEVEKVEAPEVVEVVEETAATEQPAKVAEVDTDGGEGDEPKTAQEWDEESQRVEEATREALARAGLLVEETEGGNPMHNETLNPGDIYAAALEALPPQDIDHSGSDLYLRKTPAARALIQRLTNRAMLSSFTDSDGCAWYDLPFCFTPYWENPTKY
jgi:hypothetical protein